MFQEVLAVSQALTSVSVEVNENVPCSTASLHSNSKHIESSTFDLDLSESQSTGEVPSQLTFRYVRPPKINCLFELT